MRAYQKEICGLLIGIGLLALAGCETSKGVARGVSGVAEGIAATAEGAAKDSAVVWVGIMKADDWMRKNLW